MSPDKMENNSLPLPQFYRPFVHAALCCGEMAFLELFRQQSGQVFGVTSRGIFIRTEAGGLVFLSFETFRGPLTINLAEPFTPFQALQNGEHVFTGENRLQIPAAGIQVLAAPEVIWHIPPPDLLEAAPLRQRLERCTRLATRLVGEKGNAGFSPILCNLLSLPENSKGSQIEPALQPLLPLVQRLPAALQKSDLPSVVEILVAFLGCGRGLTPSGDDFVMGLLLMLNRWPRSGWKDTRLEDLNARLIASARQRTTSLSAALLACATRSEADERLMAAVDFICSGHGDEASQAEGLAGWGASSGLDALAGMAAGLSEN
jgi:hypothetical protein